MRAWTGNNEDFIYDTLEDLICDSPDLEVGDVVYYGDRHYPELHELCNADTVLEAIQNSAWDFAAEYSECVLDRVDAEAKGELNTLLQRWMKKHLTLSFYQVWNTQEYVITEGDLKKCLKNL